jgi:FixJ family two-component response regulator
MTKEQILEIKIHNAETGEIITRPLNEDELAQSVKDTADWNAAEAAKAQKAADKAALLAQLGITEEQAKLLLG